MFKAGWNLGVARAEQAVRRQEKQAGRPGILLQRVSCFSVAALWTPASVPDVCLASVPDLIISLSAVWMRLIRYLPNARQCPLSRVGLLVGGDCKLGPKMFRVLSRVWHILGSKNNTGTLCGLIQLTLTTTFKKLGQR